VKRNRNVEHPRTSERKEASPMGRIVSINVSERKRVPKKPVDEAELLVGRGVAGDAHAAPGDRQVSLLMVESIERARAAVERRRREGAGEGQNLDPGILVPGVYAENLTTSGIDLLALRIGDEVRVGTNIRLRVSKIGKECHTQCAIYHLVGDCVMPREGIFCEVVEGGSIRKGDTIEPG
jgi:MOSC domain-containing protein YiiM